MFNYQAVAIVAAILHTEGYSLNESVQLASDMLAHSADVEAKMEKSKK